MALDTIERYIPRDRVVPPANQEDVITFLARRWEYFSGETPPSVFQDALVGALPVRREGPRFEFVHTSSFRELLDSRPDICFGDYGSGKSTMSAEAARLLDTETSQTLPLIIDQAAFIFSPDKENEGIATGIIADALLRHLLNQMVKTAGLNQLKRPDEEPEDTGEVKDMIFGLLQFIPNNRAYFDLLLGKYSDPGYVTNPLNPVRWVDDNPGVRQQVAQDLRQARDSRPESLAQNSQPNHLGELKKYLEFAHKKLWIHLDGIDCIADTAEKPEAQADFLNTTLIPLAVKIKHDLDADVTIFAPSGAESFVRDIDQLRTMTIAFTRNDVNDILALLWNAYWGGNYEQTNPISPILFTSRDGAYEYFIYKIVHYNLTPRAIIDMFRLLCDNQFQQNPDNAISVETVDKVFRDIKDGVAEG